MLSSLQTCWNWMCLATTDSGGSILTPPSLPLMAGTLYPFGFLAKYIPWQVYAGILFALFLPLGVFLRASLILLGWNTQFLPGGEDHWISERSAGVLSWSHMLGMVVAAVPQGKFLFPKLQCNLLMHFCKCEFTLLQPGWAELCPSIHLRFLQSFV